MKMFAINLVLLFARVMRVPIKVREDFLMGTPSTKNECSAEAS